MAVKYVLSNEASYDTLSVTSSNISTDIKTIFDYKQKSRLLLKISQGSDFSWWDILSIVFNRDFIRLFTSYDVVGIYNYGGVGKSIIAYVKNKEYGKLGDEFKI